MVRLRYFAFLTIRTPYFFLLNSNGSTNSITSRPSLGDYSKPLSSAIIAVEELEVHAGRKIIQRCEMKEILDFSKARKNPYAEKNKKRGLLHHDSLQPGGGT